MKKKLIENIDDKVQVSITVLIVFFLIVTSMTYIYYSLSNVSNKDNLNISSVMLELDINRVLPVKDEKMVSYKMNDDNINGLFLLALKNGCLDNNDNVVCKVYKITVKNKSDTITQVIDGSISFYTDNKLSDNVNNSFSNLKWRLIEIFDEEEVLNSKLGENETIIASNRKKFFVRDMNIKKSSGSDYYLIVWDNGNRKNNDNDLFVKVEIESSSGTNITSIFEG